MNHTVKSLLYVVECSVSAVDYFANQLQNMQIGDKRAPPILKALTTEADVLSSALVGLSKHVEALPDPERQEHKYDPKKGRMLLQQAQFFFAAIEVGICKKCGGVNRSEIA